MRALTGGTSPTGDPVQRFYFPTGSFDTLAPFTALLDALENAFIGAYLNATIEFAEMAADTNGAFNYKKMLQASVGTRLTWNVTRRLPRRFWESSLSIAC